MTDSITKPKIKDEIKVERPRMHKVILVNEDFTPREFVVTVLKAQFRMSEDQALRVMMTARRRGACVVAVYTKDVAEAIIVAICILVGGIGYYRDTSQRAIPMPHERVVDELAAAVRGEQRDAFQQRIGRAADKLPQTMHQ